MLRKHFLEERFTIEPSRTQCNVPPTTGIATSVSAQADSAPVAYGKYWKGPQKLRVCPESPEYTALGERDRN